jgi:hypothetical protein
LLFALGFDIIPALFGDFLNIERRGIDQMRRPKISHAQIITALAVLSGALAWGQSGSSLQYTGQTIQIPGWKSTGTVGNANVDLLGYNPVTRLMYLADRTNKGIDVIDTHTNTVVGLIPMPATSVYTTPTGPNGVWVAINLQQLVVTDGLQSVYVWDLRAPQAQPDVYTFPTTMGTDTDGIAYDPINQAVYVVTDNPPEYLIGINLAYKTVVTQAALPVSADLIAFNPTDGKIYIAAEDAEGTPTNNAAGVWSFDPANGNFAAVAKVGAPCPGHGIDIDPIANVAVVGCAASAQAVANLAVNLTTGATKFFPDQGGTDAVVFNPNTRRFYANGSNYSSTAAAGTVLNCPTSNSPTNIANKRPGVLGIYDAMSGSPAQLDGLTCGPSGHIVGVDPITNLVYVPTGQYPLDPTTNTSGVNGLAVFRDNNPPAQPLVTSAQASLTAAAGSSVAGTVQVAVAGRKLHLTATATNLPNSGVAAWLTVPTTITNEFLACAVNPTNHTAFCGEDLLGDPLIGATVTLSVDSGQGGAAVARGTITGH